MAAAPDGNSSIDVWIDGLKDGTLKDGGTVSLKVLDALLTSIAQSTAQRSKADKIKQLLVYYNDN